MSAPEDERERVWKAIGVIDDRITEVKAVLETRNDMMRESVVQAVKEAMPKALLTDEEHRWVQLAIKKQEQSIALRQSIIDKSLTGLIWAAIIAVGVVLREYAVSHGMWRP